MTDLIDPDCTEMNYQLRFIRAGQIAMIINDTLYVHGAFNELNMGYIPPYNSKTEQRIGNLREWTREINEFAKFEIEDYILHGKQYALSNPLQYWAKEGGYDHPQPGSRLIHYGMAMFKDKSPNPTVIYANWFEAGRPAPMHVGIAKWLSDNGIKR
jgi:hypothetical protein